MADPITTNLLKKLGYKSNDTTRSIADSESSNNLNSQIATSYNVEEGKTLMRQQAKQVKEQFDKDLEETGYTPEDINEIKKSEDFWHSIFQTTKSAINKVYGALAPAATLGLEAGAAIAGRETVEETESLPRSAKEISQAYIDASKNKRQVERLVARGEILQPDGTKRRLEEEKPLMEDVSIFDRMFNSAVISENPLGDKMFSINSDYNNVLGGGVSKYYVTQDENGEEILARADFKDIAQLKKAGKVFLNNFGSTPVKTGFWREFAAGLGNTRSGLKRSLLNFGEGAYTLAHAATEGMGLDTEESRKRVSDLQKYSDNYRAVDDINNYEPGKTGGTMAWLGSGVGQGASSLIQFGIMGATARGIGALVSPALSAAGKLNNLTTFGAGAVMNYGEAYESALNAGLSKVDAAKVGMLTGAINGIIESAVGTNRLTSWLSGGGTSTLARRVLADLGGDVSETSMKRVLNTWQKQASGKIAQLFETPMLGNAIEEGIEEFSQTMSQKTVESLYDSFFADDKEVGKGKFGTEVFSKETLKEALEAGFFGAILGGSMGSIKVAQEQYNKYVKKKTSNDAPILQYLADGSKDQVLAMVETLYSKGVINDDQKSFYTDKVNNLAELVSKNEGRFIGLEEKYGKETATQVKAQAYNTINAIASLSADLVELSKKEQTADVIDEIKKKTNEKLFFTQYLNEEFTPKEDGKVSAVEYNNYLNQEDVLNNKFNRHLISKDIAAIESTISNLDSKIQEGEDALNNIKAKKGKAAKEIREEVEINKSLKLNAEFKLKLNNALLERRLDEFNEITSDTYQAKLRGEKETTEARDTAPKAETETSAPMDIQEGVEGNTEVEIDNSEKPTTQLNELLAQKEEILTELETNEELDPETVAELESTIEELNTQIDGLDTQLQLTDIDYQNQLMETAEKLGAFADLEDVDLDKAYSAIKKEIEQLIPAYRDQGIDVSELQAVHSKLTKEILAVRARIQAAKDALLAQEAEDKLARTRDDEPLVKGINFFDRVERYLWMNAHADFWSDAEFNAIFLNTPIEEILKELYLHYTPIENLGLKAGSVIGKWNNGTNIVNPKIVITLRYRGRGLGNLNQLDGFTVNDPSEVNLTEQGYRNTEARNNKLIALLKEKGGLTPQGLKDIGFNLSWNGDFNMDTAVGRTLIKDLPAAKLVGKSGKEFYYIYDNGQAQREITNLVTDPNNELDNIPPIPEGLVDRYVVLVKANNGKLYWIGTQNQALDKEFQDSLYKYFFEQVEKLKTLTDPDEVKKAVSTINRYLEANVFVATDDPNKQNSQLQLTTPTDTTKTYGLRLKGARTRVVLDASKYSNMDDLLAELGLNATNLRKPLVNNAPLEQTIKTLSINLTPELFKKPSVSIKIDEDRLNSTLVNVPTVDNQIVQPEEVITGVFTEEEYSLETIKNETNPEALAVLYSQQNAEPDYKVEAIIDYLGSKGKINLRDFAEHNDLNNLTPALKTRYIDSKNKSEPIDSQTEEISSLIGVEVTPEDIIDVILRFGSTKGFKEANKTKVQKAIEQRYYELTGKNLTAFKVDKAVAKPLSLNDLDLKDNVATFAPDFNTLSMEDKIKVNEEALPLVEQMEGASEIKKAGLEVKIKAIVNKYKPTSEGPVFSIGTSEEILDYDDAVGWITRNLPATISIDDVNKLLGNIKNNGITFGAFADNIIYLAQNAAKGTQYHEAFHAVFRLLLNDKQIQIGYNIASRKGKPTQSDLNKLRDSSSVYVNYTEQKLIDLFYEERLAEDFKAYSQSFNQSNPLKNIWNKIINWLRFITGNMDDVQALFYNINRGKFKNATITNNKFTQNIQEAVFQIYKKGTDDAGNTIVTSQLEGQSVVSNLTKRLLQAKVNKLYPELNDNQIIDLLLAEKASFYSLDENPYYETFLEERGLSKDKEYIASMSRNLEQKRNIYTLKENVAALKKDIKSKISIFDIEEDIANDERQAEIDSVGESFDTDPWTIGGETSFSKVLREYISLVSIKTKDEYGQDMDEAVDFKKVYRGLVRALAGIEEDKILPRFKALAEFDEDISAVFNQLLLDLGLTNEGGLNAQDITKNYDLWRKFVTAFNNENVSWYTILQSKEQSRLLESNNNSAKDIQFNNWLQNYNIAFEEAKFNDNIRTSINEAADIINRTENVSVSTLVEAKSEAKRIVNEFKKLSIVLSEGYVAYSLIKKSPYKGLDQEAKDMLSAFSGVEGLYDGGNIPYIVTEFKSDYNPFLTTRDEKKKERGAVTRIKTIAQQNALFDPTIGESSFQNADGKSVYSIIRPSFGLVKLRWLRDSQSRAKVLSDEKTKKDDFIDPLESITLNHLLANDNIELIMNNLTPSMIDGYRQTKIEGDVGSTEEGEGVTFGKFNAQEYLLADMLMFLSNRKILNTVDENGKPLKVGESAMFNINQMESSNTGYAVFLPVNDFTSINKKVTDTLFNYLAQEAIRINKVKKEFGKKDNIVWNNYNDSTSGRGFKLMEFAGYGLDDLIGAIATGELTNEEVYQSLKDSKKIITDLIEKKLESDIQQYVEVLENNDVLSLLPKVELIKRQYLTEGEKQMTDSQVLALVTNQYLNSYINTLGINNLLLDNYAKKVKNTVDWFKRAKGIIGSGADMGAGTTKVAVYKEPLKYINVKDLSDIDRDKLIEDERIRLADGSQTPEIQARQLNRFAKSLDKGKIQIADAQSYVTLEHKILQLKRWGRFPQQVSDIYDKLVAGKQITWEESNTLADNNAALNSTKTVSYNGDYYFKLSEIALSARLVGKTDDNGDVIMDDRGRPAEPKEGFEYLFNKYISMLDQGVDQALPESASKMATVAPAEFAEDGKFDFTGSVMELENKFKRLQVETPSGKRSIIHGTQLIQLVHSEQDDSLAIDFKYNSDIKTLGQLRDLYRSLLADNRLESFKTALAYVRDPLSGEFNSKELTTKFYNTILESGSDEVLSNFFSPDPITGQRQFNWNLGPIVNKAEQLFLSHFSKGVLSQKVPGLKVSLVSDAGIKIKDAKTGKMRSLAHMQLDDDGNYYSECLLPPFAEELLGKNPSDKDIQDVLKMFGIRIPTQDKHSMMSLKVVGFLPIEYGSVGIFPKEIVYLSGADFDIDSEFIHTLDFYVDEAGRFRPYGTATTDENKYKEYVQWNTTNNKLLKNRIKDMGLERALKSLAMPTTVKEFTDGNYVNVGANNNMMLEAEIKFLTNEYVRTRAATIPSSLASIKQVEKIVREALDLDDNQSISPNTPLARFNANRSNMEGKDGIGPVALANVTHALLSTYGQKLFTNVELPIISGKRANGFDGIYTIDSDTNRKNDNISTLLSAMTDNAKEQLAKLLTLTFSSRSSNTNTLPVASYLLSIGYTMEEAVLFLNLPTIKAFVTGDVSMNEKLVELGKQLDARIPFKKDTKEYAQAYNKLAEENTKPLTIENMISSLNVDELEVEDLFHLRDAANTFARLQLQAGYVSNISALMSLNKGVKSTFDENLRVDEVLKTLQLSFLKAFITDDVNSYDDLIKKLEEENYVRSIDGRVYAYNNFPTFNMGKPIDRTPFDARETLLNDPNTIQNIIIYKKIMDSSKEFFLMNTPVFAKLRRLVRTDSKDLIPFFMNKATENYLQDEFPEKYQGLMTAKDNAGYMVHQSGDLSVGRDLYKLKRDPEFRNNMLIKMLSLEKPKGTSKIISIEFPTRIKAEGDFFTNLNNAFKELFMNPKTTEFARKLYYYSYYKDGLQFKNKSFINTIPTWVFKDVSTSLDRLNADFKDTNYSEYSSLKTDISDNIVDMLTSFATLDKLHTNLPKLDYIYEWSEVWDALTPSTSDNTKSYKIKSKILKNIKLANVGEYQTSLSDLFKATGDPIYEKLMDGVPYTLAGFNENLSQTTQQLLTYGRVLKSAKVFIDDIVKELNLLELTDIFLKGNLPIAIEVTYEKVKPIRENGFNSTINDVKFLDNYKTVVASRNKKEDSFRETEINDTETVIVEDVPVNLETTENISNFVEEETSDLDNIDFADFEGAYKKFQQAIDDSIEKDDNINKLDSDLDTFTDDTNNPIC